MNNVLENFDNVDDVAGKPVEAVLDAITDFLKSKSVYSSNYNSLEWKFKQGHLVVQSRIDDIIARNFCRIKFWGTAIPEFSNIKYWNISKKSSGGQPNFYKPTLTVLPKSKGVDGSISKRWPNSGAKGEWLFEYQFGTKGNNSVANVPYMYNGTLIFLYLNTITQDGWCGVDGLNFDSTDAAMRGIFETALDKNGVNWPTQRVQVNDNYKAYSYPTPSLTKDFGSNLEFFHRCSPANLTCQLIGIEISTATALMILGGAVAAIASGGTIAVWAASMLPSIQKVWPKAAELLRNADKAQDMVSDLQNVVNGADIQADNPAAVQQYSKDILNSNQQLFEVQA